MPRSSPVDARLESEIQREILAAIGALPELLLMRRNVGCARDPYSGRVVKFGTPGEADLQGVLAPHGLAVALEVKTATGRQSKKQRTWEREWTLRGGRYRVVRSEDEALAALADWKRGRA